MFHTCIILHTQIIYRLVKVGRTWTYVPSTLVYSDDLTSVTYGSIDTVRLRTVEVMHVKTIKWGRSRSPNEMVIMQL